MSLIQKPTKDKILIVSEARSGSTALWTYYWTKYYQNGINGKPMRCWLEPFNYDMDVATGSKSRVRQTRGFMRYILTQPDDPWCVKVLLKSILPINKDPMFRQIRGLIGHTDYEADKINPLEDETEEDALNREWARWFNATEKRAVQEELTGNLFRSDPNVYRVKLYRKDIVATILSHLELDVRAHVLGEHVLDTRTHWHQRQGTERTVYEYPDMSGMSTAEVAERCQFWLRTWTRESLQRLNHTSERPFLFDAEYAYEDIQDDLIAFNPPVDFDENNPMHYDNWDVCNKSGITIPKKANNYQETYDIVKNAYHNWFKHWPKNKRRRGLDRFY